MRNFICDQEGRNVAVIREGEMFDPAGNPVGAVRNRNVYDRNGKFIFHLQPETDDESAGKLTDEAVYKLFHPK